MPAVPFGDPGGLPGEQERRGVLPQGVLRQGQREDQELSVSVWIAGDSVRSWAKAFCSHFEKLYTKMKRVHKEMVPVTYVSSSTLLENDVLTAERQREREREASFSQFSSRFPVSDDEDFWMDGMKIALELCLSHAIGWFAQERQLAQVISFRFRT